MRSGERFFDTIHRIESPEGVILELHAAGPVVRLAAWLLDMAIRGGFLFLMAVPLAMLGQSGQGLWMLALFGVTWLYPLLFELLWEGTTPGKRAFGLQVVKDNGLPLDLGAAVIRNVLRSIDFLPALFALGLACMLCTRGFRRLGDLAAGTIVIYRRGALPELSWRAAAATAPAPLAPRFALDAVEQRAVVRFAERGPLLGPARARELAAIAAPLLDPGPEPEADPAGTLARIAAWISGRSEQGS